MNLTEIFISNQKIFEHIDVLSKWKAGESIQPINVEIHLTERCNCKCVYCHYAKSVENMDIKKFARIVKILANNGTKSISLSGGGEPSVHKDIAKAIEIIHGVNLDAAMVTNLIVTPEIYTNHLKYFTWVRISIDSADAETYKRIRGVNKFDTVVENIRKIISIKKTSGAQTTIGLQSVICKSNINSIGAQIFLAAKLDVDYIQIRPIETMPGDAIPYTIKEYDFITKQVSNTMDHLKMMGSNLQVIFSNKWELIGPRNTNRFHPFKFCHAYQMIPAIDVRGDMYVCCHQIERRNGWMCYGNVFRDKYEDIMANRKVVIEKLDLKTCYLGCRGHNLNTTLERLNKPSQHRNFL
ncbi:MAG: radical SAM protein [Gammaproteobacteria bacterium]|nr:radical SAM protein [Gammaproteobacteria bacterium]